MVFDVPTVREREAARRRQQRQRRVRFALGLILLLVIVGAGVWAVVRLDLLGGGDDNGASSGSGSEPAAAATVEAESPGNFAQANAQRLTATAQAVSPVMPSATPRPTITTAAPDTPPTLVPGSDQTQEQAVVQLVNAARVAAGLPELTINPVLTAVAQRHSDDMAQHSFLSHSGSDGSDPGDRVLAAGYNFRATGENVLYQGEIDANQAFTAWWNSEGHRHNMMSADFTEIGVAYRVSADQLVYYTMTLGASQ